MTIDGAPAEIERGYSAIQAMCVPAGDHQVELMFRPTIFLLGGAVTLLALLAAAVLWLKAKGQKPNV